MILSEKHGFAFIHVPKCGGLGVRRQLGVFHDHEETFDRVVAEPDYGAFDLTHLPTDLLARRFPEALTFLRAARVFAIYRDPHARFHSAVSQILKHRKATPLLEMKEDELRATVRSLMDEVASDTFHGTPSLVYLRPQCDFLLYDSEMLATDLYPIERLDEMIVKVGEVAGTPLSPGGRANETIALRVPAARGVLHRVNDVVRFALPPAAYRSLRSAATPLLTRTDTADTVAASVFGSQEVRAFVESFYAEDFELPRYEVSDPPTNASAKEQLAAS